MGRKSKTQVKKRSKQRRLMKKARLRYLNDSSQKETLNQTTLGLQSECENPHVDETTHVAIDVDSVSESEPELPPFAESTEEMKKLKSKGSKNREEKVDPLWQNFINWKYYKYKSNLLETSPLVQKK